MMVQNTSQGGVEESLGVPLLHRAGRDGTAADALVVAVTEEHGRQGGATTPLTPPPLPAARTGTHWLLTTALMMSDMFGLGALSLPADFARLGWLPGLACMACFTTTNAYAGIIYQRLILKVPQAVIFDEIGAAAYGQLGKVLVYGTVYLTILCEPVMFQLMCMEALQQALYMYNLSWQATCLIVMALMLPLAQISNIEKVAWVSILGSTGMLVAMVIVCVKLISLYVARQTPAATQPVSNQGFEVAVIGLMDIAFAFGGQQNWMRWISTMKQRNRFAAAVSITTGLMSVVYLITAVTGYAALGSDIDMQRPVSSVIGQDTWTLVMNAGILVHCIIAYQVIINVWCSTLLHMVATGGSTDALTNHTGGRGKLMCRHWVWLLVTVLCISMSAWLAYTLPFFSIIMAVVAALGYTMSMFGLPCLFAIKLLGMPRLEVALCGFLVVAATGLSGVGMVSSVQQLILVYKHSKD